jgi:hypothetical protein
MRQGTTPQPVPIRELMVRIVNTDIPCPILALFFWRKGGKPQHYLRAGSIIRASCSLIHPIFFQGYNQNVVWRAIFAENLRLNRQKDPL